MFQGLWVITICSVCLVFTSSYADTSIPSINDLMTLEDQTKTGVIRLNQKQKSELAKWLVKHGYYEDLQSYQVLHAATVSINIKNGKMLELSDNSVWEIAPEDTDISASWLSAIPIKVTKSKHPDFPYLLTNMLNNTSVKAKKSSLSHLKD